MLEQSVEAAGEVALEAAVCFAATFAVADASIDVGDRRLVCASAGDEDHVQGAVELAIAAAVEAVADRLSRRSGDRCAASEASEGGLASDPAGVGPGDDELRGRERSDARLIEQLRRQRSGELLDLAREFALFGGQVLDAARDRAQACSAPRSSTSRWRVGRTAASRRKS